MAAACEELDDPDFEARTFPGFSPELLTWLQQNRAVVDAFLASRLGQMEARRPAKEAKRRGVSVAVNTDQGG